MDGNCKKWFVKTSNVLFTVVPDETESVNKILIGAIAAAAVFAVVIGVVVFIFYRRRKTKEPEIP